MSTPYPHISDISVEYSTSKKNIKSVEVQLGKVKTPIGRDATVPKTFRHMNFDKPMEDTFSLWLLYKKWFLWKKLEEIKFDTQQIIRACGANQEYEYHTSQGGIVVSVSLVRNTSIESVSQSEKSLYPTTDDILKICPQFRILVIGKTGVGKSSLINHAFGVQKALVSDNTPGKANIEVGLTSPQNNKFVLHDSQGFEPGEEKNVTTVQNFIQQMRDKPALKDKLHAVWLCFTIPSSGGRLLETGTEDFLKLKRDGQLGNIPIVVVLTKYDILLNRVELTLNESDLVGLSDDDVKRLVKEKTDTELQETCIKPLERSPESAIPYAAVSNKEEHKDMVARLIQITEECVCKHVASEASVTARIAQRVDPMLNIKTSIEVGKKRYWKALASTAAFKGQTVLACLEVLHADIVRVWNFQDPHCYLESEEFKALVVGLVNQLDVEPIANPDMNLATRLLAMGPTIETLGPLGYAALPAIGTVVFALWVRDMYQLSYVLLRHFIAYIVDLTIVLLTLYFACDNEDVTRRKIKMVVTLCRGSPMIARVHDQIKEYDGYLPVLDRLDQETLDMIEKLMNEFGIEESKILGLRAKISDISPQPDEQW